MSIKLLKAKEGTTRKISDSYSVLNLLTVNESEKVSLAVGTAIGHNETAKIASDRAYYVLEGELIVNDNLTAKKGDVVFVPMDTEYNFKGNFKAIIVNSPPFEKTKETISYS